MAKHWLLVSILAGAVSVLAGRPAATAQAETNQAIQAEIGELFKRETKSFDDLARLALLKLETGDRRAYQKYLAAAAAERPTAAFTSERSPAVYVRVWEMLPPDHMGYISAHVARGLEFYLGLMSDRHTYVLGVEKINPLTQSRQVLRSTEEKANYASSIGVTYDGRFFLANNGIAFQFAPDGTYLGQTVTFHRQREFGSNTIYRELPDGGAYIADSYRFISRFSELAHVQDYKLLNTANPSVAITDLAVDKDGWIAASLVGENSVAVLNPELEEWIRFGGTGVDRAESLALLDVGMCNSRIVTADSALERVQVFDKNGAWLMNIPARPYSVAVSEQGLILALDGNKAVCFAPFYKDALPQADQAFQEYVRAVGLMEEGKKDEAAEVLGDLAEGNDENLATVARALLKHGQTRAFHRHYESPRILTLEEAARLAGRAITKIYPDLYTDAIWAVPDDGFLVRIDRFERIENFELFPQLHGLEGKLEVTGMKLLPEWCYAQTNHGICRFSRTTRDWQFVPEEEGSIFNNQ